MAANKRRSPQSKTGGWPRRQPESRRERFLWTDVTQQEHDEIQAYCQERHVSISQFIADLLLKDAARSKKGKRNEKVTLRPELKLTPQQHDKLELLARLHQKKSVGEYILDVLEPQLELQRLHVPVQTRMLRYYLSEDEHRIVMAQIAASGLSATSYAATMALRAIRKDKNKSGK